VRPTHYILDDQQRPVPLPDEDLMKWARWFGQANELRTVGWDIYAGCKISTVFLGLDHNFMDNGPPILWETMVFGGPMDQYQQRCSGTWEQAEAMHAAVVEKVKAKMETDHPVAK